MDKNKLIKNLKIALLILTLLSLIIFIPQIRLFIISILEKIRGREIKRAVWNSRFIKLEFCWLCAVVIGAIVIKFKLYPVISCSKKASSDSIHKINFSRKSVLLILLCYVFLAGIRIFYVSQKKSFHVDEVLSIAICNRNEYGFWGKVFNSGVEYSGKEIKDMSFFDNASVKDSLSDIYYLHINNFDSPHTNFYYSLLRLFFTGVKTSNINYIIWRGCILNLLFYTVSFIFLILILREFVSEDNIFKIIFCLVIAFVNPNSISLTLFLRPYELQQTMVIILCYYVIHILNSYSKQNNVTTLKNFIAGIFVLSFTLLSGYFNFILVGLLGLSIIILSIKKKDFNLLYFFIYMFIASLILAKIIYLSFGQGLMEDRGTEALGKMEGGQLFYNLKITLKGLWDCIFIHNIFLMIFVIAALTVFLQKSKSPILLIVAGCLFGAIFLTLWFAPYKTERYISPYFAALVILFIRDFKSKKIEMILHSSLCVLLLLSLIPIKSKQTVTHIDDASIAQYSEINDLNKTIYIQNAINWKLGMLIPYLKDDAKVVFIDNAVEILEALKENDVLYLYQNSNEKDSIHLWNLHVEYEQKNDISDYSVYLVKGTI